MSENVEGGAAEAGAVEAAAAAAEVRAALAGGGARAFTVLFGHRVFFRFPRRGVLGLGTLRCRPLQR